MKLVNFLWYYVPSLVIVYLSWIGAQFVFKGQVEIDCVDIFIAVLLAWYIGRDCYRNAEKLGKSLKKNFGRE